MPYRELPKTEDKEAPNRRIVILVFIYLVVFSFGVFVYTLLGWLGFTWAVVLVFLMALFESVRKYG